MATEARHRRMELAGFIVCVLYGLWFGRMKGGPEPLVVGGGVRLLTGSMFGTLLPRIERMPRHAIAGGVVIAALMVGVGVLSLRKTTEALYIPVLTLSGFQLGALLTASRARFLVAGALVGALPMPLIGLVAHTIASGNRELTQLIVITLFGALLVPGIGWIRQRSLDNVWILATAGAISGFLFVAMLHGGSLFFGQPTASRPIPRAEMLNALKIITVLGGMTGVMLGAMVGRNSIFPEMPEASGASDE